MCEADFCGMDAGEYYATKDFLAREKSNGWAKRESTENNRRKKRRKRKGGAGIMTNIIKVQFFKGAIPAGKEYSYTTPERVEIGDVVDIGTRNGTARALVTAVDVPEEVAAFKPILKSIVGKTALRCEDCEEFTPIGEGDHICGADPHRMPVSEYTPTED